MATSFVCARCNEITERRKAYKYCVECASFVRRRQERDRQRAKRGRSTAPRHCPQCQVLMGEDVRPDAKYCSVECRYQAHYARTGPSNRLRKFGMTLDDFAARLAAQGGNCAIPGCDIAIDGNGRRLHVDHDHSCCPGIKSCGKCIRGLLCGRHNVGLGMFADDPAMLRAAADYLESVRV